MPRQESPPDSGAIPSVEEACRPTRAGSTLPLNTPDFFFKQGKRRGSEGENVAGATQSLRLCVPRFQPSQLQREAI